MLGKLKEVSLPYFLIFFNKYDIVFIIITKKSCYFGFTKRHRLYHHHRSKGGHTVLASSLLSGPLWPSRRGHTSESFRSSLGHTRGARGTPTPAQLRGPAGPNGHTALKLWFPRGRHCLRKPPRTQRAPRTDGAPEAAAPPSRNDDPGGDEREDGACSQAPELSGHAAPPRPAGSPPAGGRRRAAPRGTQRLRAGAAGTR